MLRAAGRRSALRVLACALAVAAGVAIPGTTGLAAPGDGAGSLLAFGVNQFGQLGNATGTTTQNANPVPTTVALPGAIGSVVQMAGGGGHTLAVTSSGQLYAFGDNYFGELGNATGNATANAYPTPTLVTLPGQTGVVTRVAAGFDHSLAATSSGQLYAFGYNSDGQLGNATNNGTVMPNPTPALVGLPGQIGVVTQLAAGYSHSLVATASGQLYAFGYNYYGQLGNATNNGATTPNPTPTQVTLPGREGTIADLAAGLHDSLVLTSSGQLYAFGYNQYGQLGSVTNINTTTANPTPTLVTLPGQVGAITRISAGADHSLVVTSSGQLYAFGHNNFGQLGSVTTSGTDTPNPTPALVTLPGAVGPVTQVAGGYGHSLAVTSSGQLYGFGLNRYGQLGSATNNGAGTPNPTPALAALPAGTTIDTVGRAPLSAFSLALVSNLAIATASLPSAQVGATYQAALQGAGGTSPFTWSATGLPAGLTFDPAGPAISGTPTAAGTSSLTVVLTDVFGSRVSRTLSLTVTAPPGPSPGGKVPKLAALKQSASKWLLGSKLARLVTAVPIPVKRGGVPVGTTFSFTLDQAASVTLTFKHAVQGRKVAGKCVAKTKGNASKPRCTRTLSDGTLRVQGRAGVNRLRFEGRVSASKKLKPGVYSVVISARSTGKPSPAKTLRFTIVAA